MSNLLPYAPFIALLFLAFFIGRHNEQRHIERIQARENGVLKEIIILTTKTSPSDAVKGELVVGSIVVASDYYKNFIASIISLFGGSMPVYESLLERGRRESILRMKMKAKQLGATAIVNVKINTVTLSVSSEPVNASIEIVAYGTAIKS